MSKNSKIIYTKTDEAPALATQSLLPIVRAFTGTAGIEIELKDISLAGRIIAHFPDYLKEEQRLSDALSELGELTQDPLANIIKLPNISASIPQLKDAIKELREQGYALPHFPDQVETDKERDIRQRYSKVLGSAVNPVLREGNSDRRVAASVKEYAKENPHSMGAWDRDSQTHVAHMDGGDFYGSEKSYIAEKEMNISIEFMGKDGVAKTLKEKISLKEGEVIDSSLMSCAALRDFYEREIQDAMDKNLLLSLHFKATMMKVSDPIMFGEAVRVYFSDLFDLYGETFSKLGVDPRNGLGDMYEKLKALPQDQREEIEGAIEKIYEKRPPLSMVNSDEGITNLHVPSDVIIDASMPAMIRSSGKMWGRDGKLHDTKAIIPDRCYAGIYQEVIDFCKEHGAFDVKTMGNVSNVGLMAKKAEEYGSHDKTFWIEDSGTVSVKDVNGQTLMEHSCEKGDIWRMCQTKDIAVRDWVKLAVKRGRATGDAVIFWLDRRRAHDDHLISKVNHYLKDHDTNGLDIQILSPREACKLTLNRVKEGVNTISVTGNVLRDYLTDLFPILELGTSAKMLSLVPLLAGGGLFETGAGGSAPKHVEQLLKENHLRWDSLGEFLALGVSLEELAENTGNDLARILSKTLDIANGRFLKENKSPSRKVGELDNRGSHFFLAMYWAEELSRQMEDQKLSEIFSRVSEDFKTNEATILNELLEVQGRELDLKGYYHMDEELAAKAMRPSPTLNSIINNLSSGLISTASAL